MLATLRVSAQRALLLAACLSAAYSGGQPVKAAVFFPSAPSGTGDPMPFGIYSVLPLQKGNANMQKVAEGGFTTAGPYYGWEADPTINFDGFYSRVTEVATQGMGYFASIPWHPNVVIDTAGNLRPNSMAAIPESELRAYVRNVMDQTLNDSIANQTVNSWYIQPEELRPFKGAEMEYLRIVASEVHSYDPLDRQVTMYNPNHRSSSALIDIVNQGLDTTMMGVYATTVPFDTRGARIADGIDRILAAAEATDTMPVAVFQLNKDYDPLEVANLQTALGGVSSADAIKHVLRHDVYQGLIRGIEGVQIWSGCDCRDALSTYTEQLDGYISVANDVNGDLSLNDVFLRGDRCSEIDVRVLTGPQTVTYNTTTIDSVAITDIAHDGDRYIFLANSSNSPLEVLLNGMPAGEPEIIDLFANAPELEVDVATGEMRLDLAPLEVVGLLVDSISNADVTHDGQVDGDDFLVYQRIYGEMPEDAELDDFNYDGHVDDADLGVWQSQFASSVAASPAVGVVPEPSTATLAVVVAIGLAIRSLHARRSWAARV